MIFLVRHAHSDYSPDEMRGLSESGRAAALRVADLLACEHVAMIVSSPYRRAVETVQPLADRLGVSIAIEDDLRERRLSAGPVEDVRAAIEATWRNFDFAHPGGESSSTAQERVSRAIGRIVEDARDRNVVIASHGNALALFLRTIDPAVGFAFWSRMSLPDVFSVDVSRDPWSYQRLWRLL
jgi:2,3-bisphosphoglycerate-dependent phosphoglycerate mutase